MIRNAISRSLRDRRFWVWQISGVLIYATPATIRITTGNIHLPILSMFMPFWVSPFVPGNIVEKILVNAFFPGGAGAVAGETFYTNLNGKVSSRRLKFLARLGGALLWTTVWSLFQLWGYLQNVTGSYGGNLFESPLVFPLNFLLAALSILTPSIVGFFRIKLANAFRRLRREKS